MTGVLVRGDCDTGVYRGKRHWEEVTAYETEEISIVQGTQSVVLCRGNSCKLVHMECQIKQKKKYKDCHLFMLKKAHFHSLYSRTNDTLKTNYPSKNVLKHEH